VVQDQDEVAAEGATTSAELVFLVGANDEDVEGLEAPVRPARQQKPLERDSDGIVRILMASAPTICSAAQHVKVGIQRTVRLTAPNPDSDSVKL
jgi:hypothetical protein